MPYYREELLSNWPQHLTFNLPKLPQKIDPDILAAASVSGYAPYHRRLPRNYVEPTRKHDDIGVVPVPKFLSQQGRDRDSKTVEQIAEDKVLYGDDSKRQFQAPPMYRKQIIRYSRFGVDDFDFS